MFKNGDSLILSYIGKVACLALQTHFRKEKGNI